MSKIDITVSYNDQLYDIKIKPTDTVGKLKNKIQTVTKLKRSKQYFLNIAAKDKHTIESLALPSHFTLLLHKQIKGKHLEGPSPVGETRFIEEGVGLRPASAPIVPTVYITVYPAREKKLIVLDIDETIFDGRVFHDELANHKVAKRPHLKEFLKTIYPYFNIGIWSATMCKTVGLKLMELKILYRKHYRVCFYTDVDALEKVQHEGRVVKTKPLRFIWERFDGFNRTNTLICDDKRVTFLQNKENGILIKPYDYRNYKYDRELLLLGRYLLRIRDEPDFSLINHSNWREETVVYMPSVSSSSSDTS